MNNLLILGAGSDLANAIAHQVAQQYPQCYQHLAGRNIEILDNIAADLKIRSGAEAGSHYFDALQYETHSGFYNSLNPKPEVVICCFGILGEQQLAESQWEETRKIIETNYLAAVSILNIIANDFEKRKSGIIVGISSVAGERGRASNYIYGSAKAGFSNYLSGLRNRLYASGVHVLTVKPGFIRSKMTEHINLPDRITASTAIAARGIMRAIRRKKNISYTLPIWRLIMLIIRSIPESIFKKLKI